MKRDYFPTGLHCNRCGTAYRRALSGREHPEDPRFTVWLCRYCVTVVDQLRDQARRELRERGEAAPRAAVVRLRFGRRAR